MRKLLRFICEPIFRERMQIKYILNHDRSGFLNYIMTEHLRGKYNLILSKDAEIEEDVWFPHPHNIIVGGVVKIGKKCVLYHDVTLGQNRGEYPIVGNGVIIYAGAKVIGNVTIGDNANDLKMITNAGLGVAMGESAPYVKQSADIIAPTNDEDGVAIILNKIFDLNL